MPAEIGIEHGGLRVPYALARDENDEPQFFAGLVDPIIGQQAAGDFGYNTQPFKVSAPITFENWSGGCGVVVSKPGTLSTDVYSHSQGVDLSWGRRGYLSPDRQVSTDLTNTWIRALFTSLGTFVIVADEVWEWDSSTSTFLSRLSSVTPTDIIEFEGNIYVAMGDSADYQYSANGTAWTASTLTVKRFSQWAVRSGQDGSARLWGILSTGELRQTPDAVNGGTQWSAATQIGDTWETLHRMVTAADFLYIFKEEGIYSFDGLIVEDVFPARQLARPNNGKQVLLWQDGFIYCNYGDILWQFDPAARTLRQVFPLLDRIGHPEINGTITGLGGDASHIYFALKNAAGNTYFIKGKPSYRDDEDSEWHTWVYRGASDCNVIAPVRSGAIDASNPVVLANAANVAGWYILPGPGLRPEDDAAYRFEINGFVVGSWVDGGALLHTKLLSAGRIVMERGTAARYVRLDYATNGGAAFTTIAQTEGTGIVVGVPPQSVRFSRIRYKAYLQTDVNNDTPALGGIVFDATPAPMKHRQFDFAVDCGSFQMTAGGGKLGVDTHVAADHLFNATGKEVLLYDTRDRRFVCFIDDVTQGSLRPTGLKDRETYIVRAIEIGVQGYLTKWYGVGSKFLLPDLPDGAVGQQTDTTLPANEIIIDLTLPDTNWAFWGTNFNQHNSYLKFNNVNLPTDATVTAAFLRMAVFNDLDAGSLDVDLYCNDVDDGTAPTSYTTAQALAKTTATTRWELTTGFALGEIIDSADFTAAVQEIIDRAGWVEGNSITVIGLHRSVASADSFIEFKEPDRPDFLGQNPQLVIRFTLP